MKPVVWTIAGSDSGAGAGIQADLKTFNDFNVYGCTVITAVTAQNTQAVLHIQAVSHENILAQIQALSKDTLPQAIKIGMLFNQDIIYAVTEALSDLSIPIIADPVLVSTSGYHLYDQNILAAYENKIFKIASLITPNIIEAEALANIKINSFASMEKAAQILIDKGAKAVLIKGGDFSHAELASDYFSDGKESFWINQAKIDTPHTHGTGCSLSASIAAQMANGYDLKDALVVAKAYVHAGILQPTVIGQGANPIGHVGAKQLSRSFPWITQKPKPLPPPFKKITQAIGRYPVVDNFEDLSALCAKGITWIQLRIKKPDNDFESICIKALAIANAYQVNLVINDHILTALKINAPAIHLGQEDMNCMEVSRIPRETTFLGLTAHNFFELARAYAYHPSYLTMGPIFATQSKILPYQPIGMDNLEQIVPLSPLPLVAVGGIALEKMQPILNLGCSGVAFIQAAKELLQNGRYDRQLALSIDHTSKYLQAKIACVGAGGLASGFLPYLAAAGVGEITIIDSDKVDYTNLHRQILYREQDIGCKKVEVAKAYLSSRNSHVKLNAICSRLISENAMQLLSGYDCIVDGSDNFATHYLINSVARMLKIPLISAAVYQAEGQIFYFSPQSACYQCLFPSTTMHLHDCPPCVESGVLGTTPGLLGVLQAQYVLQLLGNEFPKENSFFATWNANANQLKKLQFAEKFSCSCTFSSGASQIEWEQALQLRSLSHIEFLDVREMEERKNWHLPSLHIPVKELAQRYLELDKSKTYIIYCQSGMRSARAAQWLFEQGYRVQYSYIKP